MQGHDVGASQTISALRGEAFAVDLTLPVADVAAEVECMLLDDFKLLQTGRRAMAAARAYDELSNAKKLLKHVRSTTDAAAQHQ